MDDLITIEVAAEMLNASPATLRNWRSLDRGPKSCRRGNRIYYLREDVEAWDVERSESSRRGGV